jgi:hypothetical protein
MRALTPRSGFSVVELLLVLSLLVGVMAAAYAVVHMAGTEAMAARQRTAALRDQVTLWALLTHDVSHAEASDVAVPGSDAVEFDRPVGEGSVCENEPLAVLLRATGGSWSRQPTAGRDHLWLREPGPGGGWSRRGIVSVAVANCPDGGSALRLDTDAPVSAMAFARVVEPVRLRSYASGAAHWLGMEGRGSGISLQPLAGPLDGGAFQAAVSGHHLGVTLSRVPLIPMVLILPLDPGQ